MIVEFGGEGAQGTKSGEDERSNTGVGAHNDDNIGSALTDTMERLTECVGAGRAGSRDGQVGALGAEGHRDNTGGRIEGDDGDKVWMDTMGFLLLIELSDLTLAHHHPAHAGPNDDSDAVRVFLRHLETRVSQRFLRGDEGKLSVAVHSLAVS